MTTKQWPRLIRDYGQQSRWRDAVNLLLDLEAPDVFAYSAAIGAVGRAKQWLCAVALLQDLRQYGLLPDAFIWSGLLSACERGRQWTASLALYHSAGRGLNAVVANSALGGLSACGHLDNPMVFSWEGVARKPVMQVPG
ncbi:unnamed protein product [Effrenium voratum]|nr:unnamed protein product [Effrenium voratum]